MSWISCDERQPEEEKLYVVWCGRVTHSIFHLKETERWDAGWDVEVEPTYWQLLPEPPQAKASPAR